MQACKRYRVVSKLVFSLLVESTTLLAGLVNLSFTTVSALRVGSPDAQLVGVSQREGCFTRPRTLVTAGGFSTSAALQALVRAVVTGTHRLFRPWRKQTRLFVQRLKPCGSHTPV